MSSISTIHGPQTTHHIFTWGNYPPPTTPLNPRICATALNNNFLRSDLISGLTIGEGANALLYSSMIVAHKKKKKTHLIYFTFTRKINRMRYINFIIYIRAIFTPPSM